MCHTGSRAKGTLHENKPSAHLQSLFWSNGYKNEEHHVGFSWSVKHHVVALRKAVISVNVAKVVFLSKNVVDVKHK